MRRLILIALLALATALPAVARADEPSEKDQKKAKKLILQASRHKRLGDRHAKKRGKRYAKRAAGEYRKAALAFIEAYMLIEHPAIVLKLAEVYQARGENKWALRGYRRYLELEPDSAPAEDAKEQVDKLEKLIAEHEESGKPWPEDDNAELDPTAVFGFEKQAEPEVPDEPEEPVAEPEPEEQPELAPKVSKKKDGPGSPAPGKWLRWGGMGAGGVGALLLVIGTGYGIAASSAASDLESNDDQWNLNDRQRIADGESANDKMVLFTTLGVATVAAGGVLYYLGWRAEEKASGKLAVTPSLTSDGVGFAVSGSF